MKLSSTKEGGVFLLILIENTRCIAKNHYLFNNKFYQIQKTHPE